jgi:3-oxoacyl-(acyl-carrier-protein) synthase
LRFAGAGPRLTLALSGGIPILAALVGFGAYRRAGERAKPSPVATGAVAKATAELFTYAAREPK